MTVISALLLNGSLMACAADPDVVTRVETRRVEYPAGLFVCSAEPAVPAAPVSEFDVLIYIAQLHAAYLDCRFRLGKAGELTSATAMPPPLERS
jgi:hypothetical protein